MNQPKGPSLHISALFCVLSGASSLNAMENTLPKNVNYDALMETIHKTLESEKMLKWDQRAISEKTSSLELSKNEIKVLAKELAPLPHIKALYLIDKEITEVTVEGHWGVIDPEFRKKIITQIPAEIGYFVNVQKIEVRKENEYVTPSTLKRLPQELENCKALRVLKLDETNLGELPSNIDVFEKLEELSIVQHKLQEIPTTIGKLINLKYLDFHRYGSLEHIIFGAPSSFKIIPSEIGNLLNLISLNLSGNSLEELPGELGNCKSLVTLSLSENRLKNLPPQFALLSNLERISLGRNQFITVPGALLGLTKLKDISLSENKLESIPDEIFDLPALECLSLGQNEKLDKTVRQYFDKKFFIERRKASK